MFDIGREIDNLIYLYDVMYLYTYLIQYYISSYL